VTELLHHFTLRNGMAGAVENSRKLAGPFGTPQKQAPVLQDCPFPPPLGAAQNFPATHHYVEIVAAAETQELAAPIGLGESPQAGAQSEPGQDADDRFMDCRV
jgi:hypothetical protein